MASIPAAHAALLAEAIRLQDFFDCPEAVALLEEHNPPIVAAYRSLWEAAKVNESKQSGGI